MNMRPAQGLQIILTLAVALVLVVPACGGRVVVDVGDAPSVNASSSGSGSGSGGGGVDHTCPDTCVLPKSSCYGCVGGACVYAPIADGSPCNDGDPPSTACVGPHTLRQYDVVGACDKGACVYSFEDTACAWGCVGDQCAPAPQCHDGARDGEETDVDCGGPACARCAYGRYCHDDSDCEAGACMIIAGSLPVCAPMCHFAPCSGCCCVTHGTVQPHDYACMTPSACLAAGGSCL